MSAEEFKPDLRRQLPLRIAPAARLVGAFLLVVAAASALAQTLSPLDRLRRASEITAIDTAGALPWHLKLDVTLAKDQPLEGSGTIEEWWSDPTHFRITYDLPAYKATFLRQGEATFHTPDAAPPPFELRFLLAQVVHPITLPAKLEEPDGPHLESSSLNAGKVPLDAIQLVSALPPHRVESVFYLAPANSSFVASAVYSQVSRRNSRGTFRGKDVPIDLVLDVSGTHLASTHVAQLQGRTAPYPEASDTATLVDTPSIPGFSTAGLVIGKLVHSTLPIYPLFMREQHEIGTVFLDVLVAPDGHVQTATPIYNVSTGFSAAAVDAVKRWLYTPSLLNGVPTPLQTVVTVNFAMRR